MGLFFVLTPLNAAPTGEIIFVHPINSSEIWISNVEGSTARKLFRQTFGDIDKIEVQENGEYVLVVADKAIVVGEGVRAFLGSYDIYLLDRKNPIRKAKKLNTWTISETHRCRYFHKRRCHLCRTPRANAYSQ